MSFSSACNPVSSVVQKQERSVRISGNCDVALCLIFPGQQPFNTFRKLETDPKQNLRSNFHLASFHRREIVLANANAFGELFLRHIEAAHLPNAAPYGYPID